MKKILIVDDEEKNRYMAHFFLEKSGFLIVDAINGQDAFEKAAHEMPDLILMDMRMPGMDGYEATRKICADDRLAKIPVVAMTAYGMKGDREKALAAGCSGYIKKPIDPETFVDEVKRYL